MLREMAKLAGGMLFMRGHLTDPETVRRLARDEAPSAQAPHCGHPASDDVSHRVDWRTPLELLMLSAIFGGSFACIALGALALAGTLPL